MALKESQRPHRDRRADLLRRARPVLVMNRRTGQVAEMLQPGPDFTRADFEDLRAYTARGWLRGDPSFQVGA